MNNIIDSDIDNKVFENFVLELKSANRTCQMLEAFDIARVMLGITFEDIDEFLSFQNDRGKTIDSDILN